MEKKALYFGYGSGGHFLRDKDGKTHWRHIKETHKGFPYEVDWLDGSILKNRKIVDQPDGRVHVTGGGSPEHFWFAFVWWDRSGDRRDASNSGFYVTGFGLPVKETYFAVAKIAFDYACKEWPDVVARQLFPLTLVEHAL